MLTVVFDLSSPKPKGTYEIRHFRGYKGDELTRMLFLDIFSCVLASAVVLLAIRANRANMNMMAAAVEDTMETTT
eukprot:6496609-Prymnesium_polylepis.1